MEFFTHIDIAPFEKKIDHTCHIFSTGSCFAQNIAQKLLDSKFQVTASPTGILFNPESIARCIEIMDSNHNITEDELRCANEVWFSYDFHSSYSATDKHTALEQMQQAVNRGAAALKQTDVVIITFGTAWVYRLLENDKVVANCHKQPHSLFSRERQSVAEITERWSKLLSSTLKEKQVIFTVSPIRHLSDGLEQNSLSKSTLRIAIAELTSRHANAHYFPSFEIMNDELRDYRFYADDMVHPTPLAIDYIWQRFAQVAIEKESLDIIERIKKISQAAMHRPLNPNSESHKEFCRRQLAEIEKFKLSFPTIDFSKEKAIFVAHL